MAKRVSKAEFKHSMSKRMVSVSDTKFDKKAKKVRGPGGKLFTGAVDMGNGRTQTYENGVRVKISAAKKGFRGAPSAGGSKGKGRPAAPASNSSKPDSSKAPSKTSKNVGVNTSTISGISKLSGKSIPTSKVTQGSKKVTVDKRAVSGPPRSMPATPGRVPNRMGPFTIGTKPVAKKATLNRPSRNQAMRLQKDKSGKYRWVKVIKRGNK